MTRNPLPSCAAFACFLASAAAQAGLFPTYPTGTGPGVWEADRYPPAGFANGGTVFGRPNVLNLDLSSADSAANRPPAYSSTYYNTQGRGIQVDLSAYSVIYGSVYLPAAWATTNPGDATLNRRTEMWGVLSPATGGDICPASACNLFPIVGFTNASASQPLTAGGTPRFRVFDSNIGFVDLPTAVSYDTWSDVCIAFPGTELRFYVNGALVYTQSSLVQGDPSFGPPNKWTRTTMQGYNFGTSYTANWSGLGAGKLGGANAASGNGQSANVGTAFAVALKVVATDAGGAPLPCVPVTFAAPASGASATLSATSVVTNMQGEATVTATANAVAGSYVVTAAAPGVGPVQFNLTNLGVPTSIAVNGGSGQATFVNTGFASPLSARVTDGAGAPVAGVAVTFTLPASGPGATFPGGVLVTAVATDVAGVATSPPLTANGLQGGFTASATAAGVTGAASFALTNIAGGAATPVPSLGAAGVVLLTLALGAIAAFGRRRRGA